MPLSASDAQELYLSELDDIERALRFVCRRNGLSADEAEEFCAEAHVRLIDDDYRPIRAFDDRCTFSTYITTVLIRLHQDFRNLRWGKWRPSAAARRAGEVGIRLETLVVRDGFTFDETVKILSRNHGLTTPREELRDLLHSFPLRHGRASRQKVALHSVPEVANGISPEEGIASSERANVEDKLVEVLRAGIRNLEATDQLILRMVYLDGHRIAAVADLLGLERRPLYRRLTHLQERLRPLLENAGVTREKFRDLLDSREHSRLELVEIFGSRPSHQPGDDGPTENAGP
jgi:RNA polymerase sigma factor (sigma-70 family)